jgi:hypothetical protein
VSIRKFPEFFDIDSLVHHKFLPSGQCYWSFLFKFCRGCAMQFIGRGATSGRDSGFCITITHRATHRLVCSISSPRKTFLSLPNHHNLWISLHMTFGCSLLWKWVSRGHVLQPWRAANQMWQSNSGRFQKKPSTDASNSGRIDGASESVCTRVLHWRWLGNHCHMSYHYIAIPPFWELFWLLLIGQTSCFIYYCIIWSH